MDERSAPRTEIDRPTDVVIEGRHYRALVYNLSTEGCMIDSAEGEVVARLASIRLTPEVTATGTVIWQRGCHQGIRFDRPISVAVVEELGFAPPVCRQAAAAPAKSPDPISNLGDLRQYRRVSVDRHVVCETARGRGPVLLYDLSVGGCMYEADAPGVGVGEQVSVVLAGFSYPATVIWAIDGNVGAAFAEELHSAIVGHYGFNPTSLQFREAKPRDRFGRPLPPLPGICA